MKTIKKFDILLVLIILAVLAVIAMKFININSVGVGSEGVSYKSAEVEFVVEGVRIMTIEALNVGDTLYSNETNNAIGKIKEVIVSPYVKTLEKLDGTLVQAEVPEKYKAIIVVDTELSERNTGYFAQGITEIKTNSKALVYTKYVEVISVVGGINFVD